MDKILLPSRKKNRLEMFLYKEWMFFVTMNTQNHEHIFGEVVGEEMKLNQYGKIVEECRNDLPNHYKNCELFDFIIMPNHIHVIIDIERNNGKIVRNGFKPFPTTKEHWLSEIIRWFKTFSSRKIHQSWLQSFKRQKSFYDHIIRNESDLQRIQEYIELNPYNRDAEKTWSIESFYDVEIMPIKVQVEEWWVLQIKLNINLK